MKKWFAYLVLFAVVLLSVPRSWVHECDHDHVEAGDTDNDHEDCFVCDLNLEKAPIPPIHNFNFANLGPIKPVELAVEAPSLPEFNLAKHRGPPTSC